MCADFVVLGTSVDQLGGDSGVENAEEGADIFAALGLNRVFNYTLTNAIAGAGQGAGFAHIFKVLAARLILLQNPAAPCTAHGVASGCNAG